MDVYTLVAKMWDNRVVRYELNGAEFRRSVERTPKGERVVYVSADWQTVLPSQLVELEFVEE
jgi:hypothetical protein